MDESLVKNILELGTTELVSRGKLVLATKTIVDAYVNGVSSKEFLELIYSDFNKVQSVGIIFNDDLRTISYGTITSTLFTNKINIGNAEIKAIKLNSTISDNIVFKISKDSNNWFTIPNYNIHEIVDTNGFYLKFDLTETIIIKNLIIIYEQR